MGGLNDFLASFDNNQEQDKKNDEINDNQHDKNNKDKKIKLKLTINKKEVQLENKKECDKSENSNNTVIYHNNIIDNKHNINDNNVHKQKININSDTIEDLFKKSGTPLDKKQNWMEMYQKGLNSKKNTKTVQKILNGRFRINKEGNMEILPDLHTESMTLNELLNTKWF